MQIRPAPEATLARPRPPKRRLRRSVVLVLVLAAAAIGYTAWWLQAAAQFRDGALAWLDARIAEGWRIERSDVARRGFPLHLGVGLAGVTVAPPSGAWTWSPARLDAGAPVFGDRTLRVDASGEQAIALAAVPGPGWSGAAEVFTLDLDRAGDAPPVARMTLRALALGTPAAADAGPGVGRLDLVSRGDPAAAGATPDSSTWDMTLDAGDVRLPAEADGPLGRTLSLLAVDAKLAGRLDPALTPADLARWRDAGGVLEVTRLVAVWGPSTLQGDGTLALDDRGQPIGAMTMRIEGFEATLDQLAAAGTIPMHAAATAKILLRALARTGGQGQPTLVAPLSLQDRMLSVGPVPLLRVPEVTWLDPNRGR